MHFKLNLLPESVRSDSGLKYFSNLRASMFLEELLLMRKSLQFLEEPLYRFPGILKSRTFLGVLVF